MPEPPRTSFIPKQDAAATSAKPRPRRSFNIFNFLMTVVFLGAIILAVGVYILEARSEATLEAKKQELADIKTTFNRGDIVSLRELSKRIDTAERLIARHLSPSVVFEALERRTQGEVQFQTFSYTLNESGTLALSLNGIAPRFNTVALQSQEFAEDSVIERALFSNLGITYEGEGPDAREIVRFTTTAKIDTSLMRFEPPQEGDSSETEGESGGEEGEENAEGGEIGEIEGAVQDDQGPDAEDTGEETTGADGTETETANTEGDNT